MRYIKIDLDNYTKDDIELIIQEIKNEQVVVLPTDTIYGLSAIATSQKAINKIYKIKKRTSKEQKHLILLVKSFCMVRRYCYLSKKQYNYLKEKWIGGGRALTVILKGREGIIDDKGVTIKEIVSEDDGISVRLPDNKFLLDLIKKIDEPIVSTSLNITEEKDLKDISKIEKYFKDAKPDLIVDAGFLPEKKPSRLINLMDMNNVEVYRE